MKKVFTLFLSLCFCITTVAAQITITEARENNTDGTLVREGQTVQITGIAIGPNFRSGGLTFILYDVANNIGITVFALDNSVGYTVTDGDELTVDGELAQFNGLAEIVPSSIVIESQGNPLPDPTIITGMDESTESNLIRFENAMLADPSEWALSGSFNVNVTNGTNTIQVRVDSDIDIAGMDPPLGTFTITGVGGQFDANAPFDSGYQLLPRAASDISPYNTQEIEYDKLSIAEARQTDSEGVLSKLGSRAELNGVVHGINLRPGGLQFSIIDATNTGIAVFSFEDQFSYSVSEGDDITVQGELSQFSGLAQIEPDTIMVNSVLNDLSNPLIVSQLNESTESSLITVDAMHYVDESEWLSDGSSFNVGIVTINGDTLTMRIDNDTELSTVEALAFPAYITGIGGQFDGNAPFDMGYQILPRYISDFDTYLGIDELYTGYINLYPNPVENSFRIDAQDRIENIEVYDLKGRVLFELSNTNQVDMSQLRPGTYLIKAILEDAYWIKKVIKQ